MITIEELSAKVYEDLNGRIISVGTSGPTYRVGFECDDWNDPGRRRFFEFVFEDVPEATATPSRCGEIHDRTEHPLLWEYNDEHASMFFSSAPHDSNELIGRLYEAHEAMFSGWRPLSSCLYSGSRLLDGGRGLLARGPRRVVDEYSRVVGERLRYSIIDGHKPSGGYSVMLFEGSYVIYRSISAIERTTAF